MRRDVLGIFGFLLAPASALVAQQTVPVSAEPRHHFQMENAYIRVYDVVVPPGDTTFFHLHAVDYTYVSIGAADLVAQLLGGEPTPLLLRDTEVRFTKGPITHRVWNVGGTPFHNITIELPHNDSTDVPPPLLEPGDSLALDNDRVRAVRRSIPPGGVARSAGRALVVLLSGGRLRRSTPDGEQVEVTVAAGSFHWLADSADSVRNVGDRPIVVLIFTVK